MSRTTRGKRTKQIQHEIFLLCANIEKIQHWISLFTECAYGKFPTGVSYKDGVMYLRQKKRTPSKVYKIPSVVDKACKLIKEIFRNDVGIITKDEYMNSRVQTRKLLSGIVPAEKLHWSMVSSPIVRNRMISEFCLKLGLEKGWKRNQCEMLTQSINLGMLTGSITSNDIILRGYAIHEILGLSDEDCYYNIEDELENKLVPIYKPKKKPQKMVHQIWKESYSKN